MLFPSLVVIVMVVIVIVIVIVMIVIVLAQQQIVVDLGTGFVDDLRVLEHKVERTIVAHLRNQFADRLVLLVGLAHFAGLLACTHRNAGVLSIELVVGHREGLSDCDRA